MSRSDELAYALGGYKFVTWLLGVWPLNDAKIFADVRFAIVLTLLVTTISCIVVEILLNCGDGNEILEYIGLISGTTAGLTKVLFVKLHRSDLATILRAAINDWSSIGNDSKRKTMLKYARRARTVGRFHLYLDSLIAITIIMDTLPWTTSGLSSTAGTSNATLFLEEGGTVRETPFRTNCLFLKASTPLYWLLFTWQSLQLFTVVICDAGNDAFFFAIAMHLCGQFESLKFIYSEVEHEDETQSTSRRSERSREDRLKLLFAEHSRLLELTARLKNTFNIVLLVMLGNNALHLCFLGVQILLATKTKDPITLMKCVIAVALVLEQLFLYSYAGENLSSFSKEVGRTAYEIPWYELTSKNTKNLLYVIARANVPFRLTAGRFCTVNLETFKEVLKASFSYFSVLRLIFDE